MAARRTAALAKYLARAGHPVSVLTSQRSGEGSIDGAIVTVRTHDLAATRINWRRPASPDGALHVPTGPVRGIEMHAVPDIAMLTWLPFALPRAIALARKRHFDCVITSSPPASAHLIGPALQRRGLRWIADFRDGWTFDPPRPPWPLALEQRLDAALERSLVRQVDLVTAVTSPIVDDLRARFDVDVRLLNNGYDPEERLALATGSADPLLSPDRHSLVHTGRAAIGDRNPTVVFEGLQLLRGTSPHIADRVEVVFAGPMSREELDRVHDPALRGMVRSVGTLDRRRTLTLQQAADSLLVIATGAGERSVATGKLFEYLTAGPPILVVGDRSEAARVVLETGTGVTVASDSPGSVAGALVRLVEGLRPERRPTAIARYSWETLSQQASQLIEDVRARPRRGRLARRAW